MCQTNGSLDCLYSRKQPWLFEPRTRGGTRNTSNTLKQIHVDYFYQHEEIQNLAHGLENELDQSELVTRVLDFKESPMRIDKLVSQGVFCIRSILSLMSVKLC